MVGCLLIFFNSRYFYIDRIRHIYRQEKKTASKTQLLLIILLIAGGCD